MEPSILQSLSAISIWGSISASLVLSAYILVQAFFDPQRKLRLLTVGFLLTILVGIDLAFPALNPITYEMLRSIFWAWFGASALLLLGIAIRTAMFCGAVTSVIGALVWFFISPNLATSVVLPISFWTATLGFSLRFKKCNGFASCIIAAGTAALGISCVSFVPIVTQANPLLTSLGYAHYAFLSITTVVLGWLQLPRELRGKAPVVVSPKFGAASILAIIAAEMCTLPALAIGGEKGLPFYIAGTCAQIIIFGVVYFYYRHNLIIYTDKIEELLAERTESLRVAQGLLENQVQIQEQRLQEQATELTIQAEAIQRQQRLELAAQTAGQVAHDLQNLVSPLMIHLEKLVRLRSSNTEVSELVQKISVGINDILELNAQLLSLSRRGRRESYLIPVQDMLYEIARRFDSQRVSVLCDSGLWFKGSWAQSIRAIANLVQNGLESAPGAIAAVSLRASMVSIQEERRCHLGFLAAKDFVVIEVSDNGKGIPAEVIDRMFEPFYSSKSSQTGSGSGLGLTIVAAVIDDYGGAVDIETSAWGTTFKVYLPLERPASDSSQLSYMTGNERLLIVEDDHYTLRTTAQIFMSQGYTVFEAACARDAIAILRDQEIDVMVSDLKLPDMSAQDLLFSAVHINPDIMTVIYSSYISDIDVQTLTVLGAEIFIEKPALPQQLLSAVRSTLDDGKRYREENSHAAIM